MKKMLLVLLIAALPAAAQMTPERVADDAIVIDRLVELTGRDFPTDLLRRMLKEDIETLRVPQADGTYRYARLERLEGGRKNESFSIHEKGDRFTTASLTGENVYRVQLDSPQRKLLVTKNRPVFVERIDVEYIGLRGNTVQTASIPVGAVVTPGEVRVIDLPQITKQATVKVLAKAQAEGYGNLVVSLLEARIVDDSTSPYADAVASAKAIQRAMEHRDLASMRSMAVRMRRALTGPATPATAVEVAAPRIDTVGLEGDLRVIESLMRGDESDRRRALERLQEVIRKLR